MLFSFLFWYANIKRARGPAKTSTIKLWQSVVKDSVYPYHVKYINLIVNKLSQIFKLFNYRVEFSIPGIGRRIRFNKKGARKLLYFFMPVQQDPRRSSGGSSDRPHCLSGWDRAHFHTFSDYPEGPATNAWHAQVSE